MADLGVAGATSWGLTLSSLLARNGHAVSVFARSNEEAARVNERRGLERLPDLALPPSVTCVGPGPKPPVEGVIIAAPAQSVRQAVDTYGLSRGVPILSAAKGLEITTEQSMSHVLAELGWPAGNIAVISGPNLAPEIARGMPAAAVVASVSESNATAWQTWLNSSLFRVYRSPDVTGVEFAGAYKNVIAIAAGAAFGLGLGTNTVAAIVTRGLAEMTRIALALGASLATLQGLAGVGDLVATCFSPLSRNRRFGEQLASGLSVADAQAAVGGTVEGAWTAGVAVRLAAAREIELPIAEQVAAAIAGRATVGSAMAGLLSRSPKPEDTWPVLH